MRRKKSLTDIVPKIENDSSSRLKRETVIPFVFPRLAISLFSRTKELAIFLVLGILIIGALNLAVVSHYGLELKKNLSLAAFDGAYLMQDGVKLALETKLTDAELAFKNSILTFKEAEKEIWFLAKNPALKNTTTGQLGLANAIVEGGKLLSEAGKIFVSASIRLQDLPKRFFKGPQGSNSDDYPFSLLADKSPSRSITNDIKLELPQIGRAYEALSRAERALTSIDEKLIPQALKNEFITARNLLSDLSEAIKKIHSGFPGVLTFLGDKHPHKILVLLQNNAELRPTGGFIGSYSLLEMNDGYLTKNEFHDVYETDYQLKELIEPPEEIKALTPHWYLRDSNYSPDFSISGEKAAWFLQKSKGPSVDSVIAIDQTLLLSLLEITGPVYVPSLNNFLTRDNFQTVLSYIIETKLSGRENPKAILAEFMPIFQKQLFERASAGELIKIFQKAVLGRHLMAYSREKDTQSLFEALGADGKTTSSNVPNEDFLQIVHTNIGGNKSDAYIKETFTHDTIIEKNGEIDDILTIQKNHTWDAKKSRNLEQTLASFGFNDIPLDTKNILGRGANITNTRIYVPKGSRILEINDIPMDKIFSEPLVTVKEDPDTGQTYFFTKMETATGETATLKIRYRLPFRLRFSPSAEYHLAVRKQMGTDGADFVKNFLPKTPVTLSKSYTSCDAILKTDCSFATLWKN